MTAGRSDRSADLILPTCFASFTARILFGLWTVVSPVSSTFQIRLAGKAFFFHIISLNSKKNSQTACLLNAVAQARLFGSGALKEIDRDTNPGLLVDFRPR